MPAKKAPPAETPAKPAKPAAKPAATRKAAPKAAAKPTAKKPGARPKVAKAPTKRAPRPVGRPSSYTQATADALCADLSCGMSLRSACKGDDRPSMQTVFSWFRAHPEFLEQYTRAKVEAADALVEEMLDIADDASNDWMERQGKDAEGYQVNGEHIQRSRLRVETRKWIVAKLKPRKYGDKVDVNHGVEADNPLANMLGALAGRTLKPVVE